MSNTTTEKEVTEAFESAQMGYQLAGKPLEKWNRRREIAGQAMGMKAPGFTEEDLSAIAASRAYPGAMMDAIIFFFLLTRKDASELTVTDVRSGAWSVQRCRLNPGPAYEAAERWAEEEGFADQQSEKWAEAYLTMLAILRGVAVTEFTIKSDQKSGTDEKKTDLPLV
jgi:hypothetical protein